MSSPRHILRLGPTNKSYVSVPNPSTDRPQYLGRQRGKRFICMCIRWLGDRFSICILYSLLPVASRPNPQLPVVSICSLRIYLLRAARQYRLGPN